MKQLGLLNVVIVKKTVKKKGKRRSKEPSDGRGRCPLLNPINIIERSSASSRMKLLDLASALVMFVSSNQRGNKAASSQTVVGLSVVLVSKVVLGVHLCRDSC